MTDTTFSEDRKIALSIKVSFMISQREVLILFQHLTLPVSKPIDELYFNIQRISETLSVVAIWNLNFLTLGRMLELMDWILGGFS